MKSLLLGHDGAGRRLMLDAKVRKCHTHVIGSSGSGKSKFIEHLMRQDLDNRQGFCLLDPEGTLYDAVLNYAAYHSLDREVIPLNLSQSGPVIGFNPFQRAPGDVPIDVQVDHRIEATMHAWNVKNTEETPTLARTLRLIYTVMLERNLGLQQSAHLINFQAREVREELISDLSTPLIEGEWRELQALKAKDFRQEVLSAKNKLFKFLTSPNIGRVMGIPGRSINLAEIIEEQKVLLVNLAPSDYLSEDNARAVGALLVNEFREVAMRRQPHDGRDPDPYYLYLDEFANFVSLDMANMLDRIRKRGLFLVMAHQRFGQLDEDIIDAVLTNCRIKAVFGGLPVESAKLMAGELFINKLDPMKIKAAIYQTKFWPKYSRDEVYTRGTSHSTTSGHSSTTGGGDASSHTNSTDSSQAYSYDNWFSLPQVQGTRTETTGRGAASMRSHSSSWAESASDSDSYSDSESVADIPIFIPVPFQELSSVQYFSLADQLTELTAALKCQFERHCFIKLQDEDTQPLLVPFVPDFYLSEESKQEYRDEKLEQHGALPISEVDGLLKQQESALLQAARPEQLPHTGPASGPVPEPLWARLSTDPPANVSPKLGVTSKPARKRGPDAKVEIHFKVATILRVYGNEWSKEEKLLEICATLEAERVQPPEEWRLRADVKSGLWSRALEKRPDLVRKRLAYHLKMAMAHGFSESGSKPSATLADD